ncbi:MAG: hypothetical protein JWL87_684 [Candidatus Adlerbacteria bacterium]|nr:hypothetical protein [Candidatus Adlerbacteria bacterium]
MDIQSQGRFLLVQRLTLLVNRYDYYLYINGEKGEQIAHAEQKRFAFREQMTVWTDDSRNDTLLTIKAEKLLDIHGKFLIHDAEGHLVGYCRKAFDSSLLRSTWEAYSADDTLLFTAKEKSPVIAIVRRVLQFVPVVGDIAPFVPINFVFEKEGQVLGAHHRVWGNFRDTYLLEAHEGLAACDRRILLALGILLDALQDR